MKTITLTLTKDQYAIVREALLATLVAETRPTRVIRAAEKTQDVMPVAYGSEEWFAINDVIDDACNAVIDAGANAYDFR